MRGELLKNRRNLRIDLKREGSCKGHQRRKFQKEDMISLKSKVLKGIFQNSRGDLKKLEMRPRKQWSLKLDADIRNKFEGVPVSTKNRLSEEGAGS